MRDEAKSAEASVLFTQLCSMVLIEPYLLPNCAGANALASLVEHCGSARLLRAAADTCPTTALACAVLLPAVAYPACIA